MKAKMFFLYLWLAQWQTETSKLALCFHDTCIHVCICYLNVILKSKICCAVSDIDDHLSQPLCYNYLTKLWNVSSFLFYFLCFHMWCWNRFALDLHSFLYKDMLLSFFSIKSYTGKHGLASSHLSYLDMVKNNMQWCQCEKEI